MALFELSLATKNHNNMQDFRIAATLFPRWLTLNSSKAH